MSAYLMQQGIAATPRGGMESGFQGIDDPVNANGKNPRAAENGPEEEQVTGAEPIPGYGDLLEADAAEVYQAIQNLVLRQERLAINRLEQDKHWALVKCGFPFTRLEQNQDQSSWRQVLPPGVSAQTIAAVPNKAQDLCNKCVETLMADPPKPMPKPINDSEEAERASEMAKRWLEQDGTEAGTNDNALFFNALDAATYRSSAFLEYWVDKDGGGYVPLQIKAHPQAQDAAHPLTAQDPQTGQPLPTTDYVLRYVTEKTPDTGARQFTNNPAEAEQVWQPAIRVDTIYREHVRCYPEDKDAHRAEAYIRLGYCTLGEARRRWPVIASMPEADQVALLDWQPPRFLALLPAALRARWKMGVGTEKDAKGGSNDERMVFWYRWCKKACRDYQRGASLYVSGALGGVLFERETLSAEVSVPASALQGTPAVGKQTAMDLRELDLPLVQVRLIQDTEYRDPMGWPLIGRIAGSSEVKSQLIASYATQVDKVLHPAVYTPGTSPVAGFQVENSRATGDHIPILGKDDIPTWEPAVNLPDVLGFCSYLDNAMDSAASTSKPAQGANDQQEVSGVARNIAVHQANIAMSRFNQAHLEAYSRHSRIKVQLAMAYYRAPQLLRYVGDDGAYKQEWWTGADFALVSDVGVQPGTGTMQSPQEKVNYLSSLAKMGFVNPADAKDMARAAWADALGEPDDPHQQRVERQCAAWLSGPPDGWAQQKQAQIQQQQQVQAQMAPLMQQWQQEAQQAQATGQPVPPQPQAQPVTPVWSPFAELPTDTEPEIADMRRRRLGKLISSVKFSAMDPLWQQEAIGAYTQARQYAAALSPQAQPALPKGVSIVAKPGDPKALTAYEQAAMQGVQGGGPSGGPSGSPQSPSHA